jgi:hypothetical protein
LRRAETISDPLDDIPPIGGHCMTVFDDYTVAEALEVIAVLKDPSPETLALGRRLSAIFHPVEPEND